MSPPYRFAKSVRELWICSELSEVLPSHQNQVIAGRISNQEVVFRFTPGRHRTENLIQDELDWMSRLRAHGVHAPGVIESKHERQFETVEIDGAAVHIVAFERVSGKSLAQSGELSEPLAEQWGRLLGQMNRIAADFHPEAPFRWAGDTAGVTALGPCMEALAQDAPECLVAAYEAIGRMERTAPNYGLIHGDFHNENVYLAGDTLHPLDFDECCYHWRMFDVAQALYCLYFDFVRSGRDLHVLSRLGTAFLSGFEAEFPAIASTVHDLRHFLIYRIALLFAWTHGLKPAPRWMAGADDDWMRHLREWSRDETRSIRIVDVFCQARR